MIIHKTNKSGYYICNRAVGPNPTPKKMSYRWHKVTCKNCLRKRPTCYYKAEPKGTALIPVYCDPKILISDRKARETPLRDLRVKQNGFLEMYRALVNDDAGNSQIYGIASDEDEIIHPWYIRFYRYIRRQLRMVLK